MRILGRFNALGLLVVLAACTDQPQTVTHPPVDPGNPPPNPIGVYSIAVTGIGSENMHASVVAENPDGANASLTNAGAGLVFEQVASSSFTEGARTQGGQRYVQFTFRVRNGTGVALNNVTVMLVGRSSTLPGTALSSLKKFDGTAADPAIAPQVVPTGAVTVGTDLVSMQATYPDVLQVLTEAEAAAIVLPGDVTNMFPVGYMVRSKSSNANRTLPVPTDPNQYDGVMTLSFRLPLQSSSTADVFSFVFQVLAVTDTETRLTESIEEAQDTGAVRRLRDRATTLGATTVTVLNGSPVLDPAVPDYPGQRQICSPRTAGTAATPVATMVIPGAYSRLAMYMPGETVDPCASYFRTGTAARPATNVPFTVSVKAMDRYGNVRNLADTVHLVETNGVPSSMGAAAALAGGSANQTVTYTNYGTSILSMQGRRLANTRSLPVAGVVRTWTAGAGTTDWHTALNWSPAAVPMTLDSVYIPVAAPLDPALAANVQIAGVTVEDVATISLGAFDMTASGSVTTGATGGITNTSGRLFLTGVAQTVAGRTGPLRVTGTYSLSANLTSRAVIQVDAGRLTVSALRLQGDGN
jgi:hypothetical protein